MPEQAASHDELPRDVFRAKSELSGPGLERDVDSCRRMSCGRTLKRGVVPPAVAEGENLSPIRRVVEASERRHKRPDEPPLKKGTVGSLLPHVDRFIVGFPKLRSSVKDSNV